MSAAPVTVIETGRDGLTPLRVYHRAGANGGYAWTHSMKESTTCPTCVRGIIPPDVKNGTKRSV